MIKSKVYGRSYKDGINEHFLHVKEFVASYNVGVATRFCDEHGEWKLPNLINCTNEALVNASSLVSFLARRINNH